MENTISELKELFDEAKAKNEFQFVLTLINYTGMGAKELSTNLHEWFDAIEFYKNLYNEKSGKEKARMATLLYSTFFENSDFYNIIGSLCKIKLGFKGSSYLFWKTKKYERLLGVSEKQVYLLELLFDANKPNMVTFFSETYKKEIRNSFFHSAYSLSEEEYILHDSDPIFINNVGQYSFSLSEYFYPLVDNVISFFEVFRDKYTAHFNSYSSDKEIPANFPALTNAIILGSADGLKGYRIKNAVTFYGKPHDAGVWYDEKFQMWAGHNIRIYFDTVETIEIREALTRYEGKDDIIKSDSEFQNIVDKVIERNDASEIYRITHLLVKFGNVRKDKMIAEQNGFKQRSYPKIILPFYKQAVEIGSKIMDMTVIKRNIEKLEEFMNN